MDLEVPGGVSINGVGESPTDGSRRIGTSSNLGFSGREEGVDVPSSCLTDLIGTVSEGMSWFEESI